jgi:hypothetical protein
MKRAWQYFTTQENYYKASYIEFLKILKIIMR